MRSYFAAGAILLLLAGPVCAGLRAGAARVVISPPPGAAMAGYYHFRACDGVIDDIHASALVLDDGTQRAALVTLDLIDAPRAIVEEVRRGVESAGLLRGEHVMISATHAHTGPVPGRLLRTPDAPELGSDSAHGKYLAGLPEKIVASVRAAVNSLAPVVVSASSGECTETSFCRRFYLKDGSVGWNPGKLNPAVMLPCGPIDPEVQGIFFEPPHAPGDHAVALAVYANFSMHPDTVGGTKVSADYPGVIAKLLSGYHGKDSVVLYGNGASGNLNHLDVKWARRQSGIEEAHRLGTLIAAAMLRADKERLPVADGPLRVKSLRVPLAVPAVSPEAAEMARLTVSGKRQPAPGFMDLVRANRLLDLEPLRGEPIPAEVQVVTLGRDVAWVALPGEIFSELGLALKKRSPFARTVITTLANGSVGYVPDRRSYAEKAYEAESARVEPGSGEQLVEAAVQLLAELHGAAE